MAPLRTGLLYAEHQHAMRDHEVDMVFVALTDTTWSLLGWCFLPGFSIGHTPRAAAKARMRLPSLSRDVARSPS